MDSSRLHIFTIIVSQSLRKARFVLFDWVLNQFRKCLILSLVKGFDEHLIRNMF